MTTTIRKVALAAAAATASLGAQATLVDFNDLFTSTSTASVALGSLPSYGGLVFSGAWAYTDAIATTEITAGTKPAARADSGGFAFNLPPPGTASASVMSFRLNAPNSYFTSLDFDYATSDLTAISLYSGTTSVGTLALTKGDANMVWGSPNAAFPFTKAQSIDRIDFTGGFRFALDNIVYEVATTIPDGGNGTVPEPASFALVALALLAAGGASRRRKA